MSARYGTILIVAAAATSCADAPAVGTSAHRIDPAEVAVSAVEQPDSLRDAIARSLSLAATEPTDSSRAGHLADARLAARAWADAWSDSFFIRRVARFEAAAAAGRRAMAEADSLWRAGRDAMGREGVPTAIRLWQLSLGRALASHDSSAQARALYSSGAGFRALAELDSATIHLERAHALASAIGDYRSLGNTLGIMASVSRDRGDLSLAVEQYEQALAIRPRSGDAGGMATDRQNLGLVARELGDFERAREAFDLALAYNRAAGRDRNAAVNLTNLGDIASIRGDYAAAQSHYEEALAINRASGDDAETAFVLHDLGLLSTRRGDYARALVELSEAVAVYDESGAILEAAAARADLAAVQTAVGDPESAIATLDRAQADLTGEGEPPDLLARLALARADLAVQLGSLARADADYALAEQLYARASDEAGRMDAYQGRALLLLLRDEHDRALELLDAVMRARSGADDPRAVAVTQLLAGDVSRERGDAAAADRAFTAARAAFERLGDAAGEAAALAALGELALQDGSPLAAESFHRTGLERLGVRRVPDTRWRLHAGLGAALRARGALEPAAEQHRAAIAAIEDVASNLRMEERRTGFLSDKWQVYAALARIEQQRGLAAEAFDISERMRARQMLALLDRGRVKTSRETTAHEQDLRRRIGELTAEIEAAQSSAGELRELPLAGQSVDVAREALDAAQREYAEMLLAMRASQPDYARLVGATTVDWRTVAGRLGSDEVLLQYLLADSASSVFVLTRDTVIAIDLAVPHRTVANLVEFARHAMGRPDGSAAPRLWEGVLRRLHHYLIEPVERLGYLGQARRLVIVPHAELHFLPFGALIEGDGAPQFLVERFEIAYAPSASVWVHLGERTPHRSRRVLALAPHAALLPASVEEVVGIREVHGRRNTRVLVGDEASETALRDAAPRHGVLHFATFGVLNKHNPLFSYIELAPGDDDGRLEVHEVFDLDLDGQLVVLSACQTAVGSGSLADVPPGDDWLGLMQAFLQAGASSVVASLWPVDDRATAVIMERFHEAVAAHDSPAVALAAAQLSMLREAATAHPFYWAAFIMSGTTGEDRGDSRGR
jgi:CHAT domain-containing protein/Tfp pilus assembly protein PilF